MSPNRVWSLLFLLTSLWRNPTNIAFKRVLSHWNLVQQRFPNVKKRCNYWDMQISSFNYYYYEKETNFGIRHFLNYSTLFSFNHAHFFVSFIINLFLKFTLLVTILKLFVMYIIDKIMLNFCLNFYNNYIKLLNLVLDVT